MLSSYLALIDNNADRKMFLGIYEEYCHLMYNIAYEILNDEHLAEDAVQDSFFSIAKYFERIKGYEQPHLLKYIGIIARNAAVKIKNKNNDNSVRFEQISGYADQSTLPSMLNDRVDFNEIVAAFQKLDCKYSDVLVLRYCYGMSFSEISDLLHITEGCAKTRLYRATERVKAIIEEGDFDESVI